MKQEIFHQTINSIIDSLNKLKESEIFLKDNSEFFDALNLIKQPDWPVAVDADLICDETNQAEKIERAEGIRDVFLNMDTKDKNILDFGCGEGHLVHSLQETKPHYVVGYDIYNNKKVELDKSVASIFYDWEIVKEKGPYDIIVLYDILDHLVGMSMQDCLKMCSEVLKPDGKIALRCHPFISRHGGHSYTKFNKAYAHLFLNEAELKYVFPELVNYPTSKVIYPVKTYTASIESAGLTAENVKVLNSDIEPFFSNHVIMERINKNMGIGNKPIMQMSMQFVDIIAVKNENNNKN